MEGDDGLSLAHGDTAPAITVATLADPVIARPAAVYSVVMIVTAGAATLVQTTSP